MKKASLLSIGAATLLAGCSSFNPYDFKHPTPKDEYEGIVEQQQGSPGKGGQGSRVSKKKVERDPDERLTYEDFELDAVGLKAPRCWEEAKENAYIYSNWYRQVSAKLMSSKFKYDEFSFYTGLFAVPAGMLAEVDLATGLGAAAAGGNIVKERYNLSVQAANYREAGEVFDCMYDLLYVYDDVDNKLLDEDLTKIHDAMKSVVRKLESKQLAVTLVAPEPDEMRRRLEQVQEAEDGVAQARKDAQENARGEKDYIQRLIQDTDSDIAKRKDELLREMATDDQGRFDAKSFLDAKDNLESFAPDKGLSERIESDETISKLEAQKAQLEERKDAVEEDQTEVLKAQRELLISNMQLCASKF